MKSIRVAIAALFLLSFAGISFAAQESAAVCSVTAAENARAGNAPISVGTAVYSGELLSTGLGGQLRLQCGTVRLALAESGRIRAFQSGNRTSVELENGTLVYATAGNSEHLEIFSLDIKVVPLTSVPAMGQVSSNNHCHTSVQATKSSAEVSVGNDVKMVDEGKAYDVTADSGVDYSDSWQPILTDYPTFPRDADYHKSHSHVSCAPAYAKQTLRTPHGPTGGIGPALPHFREIAIGVLGVVTWLGIDEALESPHKP